METEIFARHWNRPYETELKSIRLNFVANYNFRVLDFSFRNMTLRKKKTIKQ